MAALALHSCRSLTIHTLVGITLPCLCRLMDSCPDLSRPHEEPNRLLAESHPARLRPLRFNPISCRPVEPLGVACTAGGSLTTSIRTIIVFGSALLSYIRPHRGGRTLLSTKTVTSRPGVRLPCCRCGALCEDNARIQAAPVSSLGASCHRSYFGLE
jgi:hypothetical protein